ncbi:LPS translocon maturation chaperone LptM [Stenotrophomonas mori]|uniref:Lipoprotein n=1 Tax=Stenotrophomonas mori TaxID=2871096 RepID=A0ABT0SI31_9GAMM|nr:lipoprotein [Stenotrophomonas mori]MCL7715000.1 lipoprotein [Stenotrophomonas mori]
MNKLSLSPMLIAAACVLLFLTACGNKGPLVMPQKPVPVEEPVPGEAPAPAATDADDDAADAEPADGVPHE